MNKVLVTGGCGYIGSHTIVDLLDKGHEVISIDSLMNSELIVLDQIERITGKRIKNYEIDLRDFDSCKAVFEENPEIHAVIHFAALKSVSESVSNPHLYYDNNLNSLNNLLQLCLDFNIDSFIFSSSCTVYGNPIEVPVDEQTPLQKAQSPYGKTKQIGEEMINDFIVNSNLKACSLRYFNPAGAHESALMGESAKNEASNLVPIITETAIGKRKSMTVYGNDYPTRDGTCIRDYIHIMDLADAHTKSLDFLLKDGKPAHNEIFNLGIGKGVTVLEAIKAFEASTGEILNYQLGPRRPGDLIATYADYTKAKDVLKWDPKFNINDIMLSAWKWEKNR